MAPEKAIKLSNLINKTTFSLLMTICAAVMVYARLDGQVKTNTTDIAKSAEVQKEASKEVTEIKIDVAVIKSTVERIDKKL